MGDEWNRRDLLRLAGSGLAALAIPETDGLGAADRTPGRVTGHPEGAAAGMEVLAAGGNAVDAAVTAALVASVVAVQMCGPGGYGGHLIIARPGGKRVVAIDFNS